jgi:hypothetical protein
LYSSDTTKYLVHINLEIQGVVEKPDVVGAIFGQTEGLLGEDLDLRDLQRTGRVGRIDVQIQSKKGETKGEILISSSLDRAETAILAASLETIDRVGPCVAKVTVRAIEDIRVSKRRKIVDGRRSFCWNVSMTGPLTATNFLTMSANRSGWAKSSLLARRKYRPVRMSPIPMQSLLSKAVRM